MDRTSRIFIAGHRGMVGSAMLRQLERSCPNLLLRSRAELDLKSQDAVFKFFEETRPDYVFMCAAKVGGIHANATMPGDFMYDNLAMQVNVLESAHRVDVKRLLFLGSSCAYPRECPQPIREDYLLTGPLETTNRAYAVAKISGIEMCGSYNRQYGTKFLAVMPTNLYGPNDNYDLQNSHVLPALIRKFHEAKAAGHATASAWGTGAPLREFLYSDDLAQACVFLMDLPDADFDRLLAADYPLVNIGCGEDVTIRELTRLVKSVVGYEGDIVWDSSKPDGTPRKLLDISRMKALGWRPRTALRHGIKLAYDDFLSRRKTA